MPGYTFPDCLPYFLCTDSPCLNTGTVCDPSTVFCDLATLIDQQLVTIDDIIARTATAVPFAKVAVSAPYDMSVAVIPYDTRIIWDTVVEDNADMVDLDLNNKAILVHTPGIYLTTSYVVAVPPNVVSNVLNVSIGDVPGTFFAQADSLYRSGNTYTNLAVSRTVTNFDINVANSGQFPFSTMIDYQGTAGNNLIRVISAEMTVYWIGDIP